jgi:23S rRNA C2498 (ribose-2'-O)-methylase RlmM
MKTKILKHLTVAGFSYKSDLSECEILENDLKEKKEIKESQKNSDKNDESASGLTIENLKLKYKETIEELESKKNTIKKKIEEYNVNGTEKWDSFKQKLNHDLEELGKAFKGFVTKAE